jgi:hypothetical protein
VAALGSAICRGTTLQAGRSRVRFPIRSLDHSIHVNLPAGAAGRPPGSTQHLTEMNSTNIPGEYSAVGAQG